MGVISERLQQQAEALINESANYDLPIYFPIIRSIFPSDFSLVKENKKSTYLSGMDILITAKQYKLLKGKTLSVTAEQFRDLIESFGGYGHLINKKFDKIQVYTDGNRFRANTLHSLPEGLVMKDLIIHSQNDFAGLPNNLRVVCNLISYDRTLDKLPNNLSVGGRLALEFSRITSLPDDLQVGGSLDISFTPLAENDKLIAKYKKRGLGIVAMKMPVRR